MKAIRIIEAALFSAGRALSVEEICEQTQLRRPAVRQAIDALTAEYAARDTVLEIGKAGAKWAMQVRRQAADPAARFAAMEIAPKLLKTLALIAFHQPMRQSDLADMIGSKVYDHVPELRERGLVKWRREGQTKILSTTAAFPEYFGLDAATPDAIREALARAVGLDPARLGSLETFAPDASDGKPSESGADAPSTSATAHSVDPPGPPAMSGSTRHTTKPSATTGDGKPGSAGGAEATPPITA